MSEYKKHKKHWTDFEHNYLYNHCETTSLADMSERLNRSPRAIQHQMRKLGLSAYVGEYVSAKTLAKCFQSDFSVVKRWIKKFQLPHRLVIRNEQTQFLIDVTMFWKWSENHKNIIPWVKYERLSLIPEPPWLKDELNKHPPTQHRKKITELEKLDVYLLYKRGYTYRQIAEKTGRSIESVKHINRKLRKNPPALQ